MGKVLLSIIRLFKKTKARKKMKMILQMITTKVLFRLPKGRSPSSIKLRRPSNPLADKSGKQRLSLASEVRGISLLRVRKNFIKQIAQIQA